MEPENKINNNNLKSCVLGSEMGGVVNDAINKWCNNFNILLGSFTKFTIY